MPVVQLREVEREPVAAVVDLLHMLLAKAEAGEIRGIVVGCACDPSADGNAYEIGDGDIARLVLAIERAKLRLLEHEEP